MALLLHGLTLIGAVASGCSQPLLGPGPGSAGQPPATQETSGPTLSGLAPRPAVAAPRGEAPSRRPVFSLQISVEILRARAARGFFSASGKIWNHLDEEAIPADTSAVLQRNGLRVARGRNDAWPPIRALLEDQAHVEVFKDQTVVSNGLPLMVELDTWPHDQTLFLIRPDGTPAGASFPESMNLLRIEYELSLDDPSVLRLRVMPELRLCRLSPELRLTRPNWQDERWAQPSRVLRELAFDLDIGPDEFLVIGPSPNVEISYVAGALFLCEQIDGKAFESMYFVTPRVYRSGSASSP